MSRPLLYLTIYGGYNMGIFDKLSQLVDGFDEKKAKAESRKAEEEKSCFLVIR